MTSGSLWHYYKDEIDDVGDNFLSVKLFKYEKKYSRENTRKTKKTKTIALTTTKSKLFSTTTATTAFSTSFKCLNHYSTEISY